MFQLKLKSALATAANKGRVAALDHGYYRNDTGDN